MRNIFLFSLATIVSLAGCRTTKTVTSRSGWESDGAQTGQRIVAGSPKDPNLRFIGRWDFTNRNNPISYWGGAYVKTKFSGKSVKLITGHGTSFFVKIDDGKWISFLNVKDTVKLTSQPLTGGWHELTIAQGKDYDYIFDFRGLILDKNGETQTSETSPVWIEYVGDSITTGYTDSQANVSDYGWIASEILKTEHTQIAYPGIDLASGYGRNKSNGMDVEYLKARSPKFPDASTWNFAKKGPQIVTINLGTNDNNNKVPDSVFTRSYISLIRSIRTKYPQAKILAMRTFLGIKQQATIAAVELINKEGDKNVFYLDTTGWITQKTADYNDSAHPSDAGQIKAGKLLAEKLKSYL